MEWSGAQCGVGRDSLPHTLESMGIVCVCVVGQREGRPALVTVKEQSQVVYRVRYTDAPSHIVETFQNLKRVVSDIVIKGVVPGVGLLLSVEDCLG